MLTSDLNVPVEYRVYTVEPGGRSAVRVRRAGRRPGLRPRIARQPVPVRGDFDGFTLKIGENRPYRVPISHVSVGSHQENVKVTYRNQHGRLFEKSLLLSYDITREMIEASRQVTGEPGEYDRRPRSCSSATQSEDFAVAAALVKTLESAGISCWIAPRDVLPDTPFEENIMNAIRQALICVIVFSSRPTSRFTSRPR